MSKKQHVFYEGDSADGPETYISQFQTPVPVARYMVNMLPEGVKTVLEPTPGPAKNIVRQLQKKGYHVTAPDDFFLTVKRRFDAVVMNPPFSERFTFMENAPAEVKGQGMKIGYWFLYEMMSWTDNIVALMPWFTISDSDRRLRMIMDYGLVSVTALPRKTFEYARIQTVILYLKKDYKGRTEFSQLPYKDPHLLKLWNE